MSEVKVSIFQRGSKWWIYFRLNGERIRYSLETDNYTDAERKRKKIENELLSGCKPKQIQKIKLDDFWNEYLDYAENIKSPRTLRNDKIFWPRFSEWLKRKGVVYVGIITSKHFEDFREYLLKNGIRKKNGLSKVSINTVHRHISAILTFAQKREYIFENPIKGISLYKLTKSNPKFLNEEQIKKVFENAKETNNNIYLVFALGIYAGMRKNEISNARWEWFNFEKEIITIQPYNNFEPKNHQCRSFPFNRNLQSILKPFRKNEGYLFVSISEEIRKSLIRFDFKNSFKEVKEKAKIDWLTPHILRHTFASQLAINRVSIYKISVWLGHESVNTTTKFYAHLQAQDDDINRI